MPTPDYHEDDRIAFSTKADFLIDALRALAPLCAKTLIQVTVMNSSVRLEACTKGLGGVVHLHAKSTEEGMFVLPAAYVDQLAKVFPPKDYSSGGHLTVYSEGHLLTFHDGFGKKLELEEPGYARIDEPAQVVLAKLLGEYGTEGGKGTLVLDPDRVRVITSVSKLILGDVIMRQPDHEGPTFVSIGQSFSGYIREPGWHDGKDDSDDDISGNVVALPGQSDIFDQIGDE